MLLLICNRELLFIGKRKDEDDMAKSTKTYEERIRALEKKEPESISGEAHGIILLRVGISWLRSDRTFGGFVGSRLFKLPHFL